MAAGPRGCDTASQDPGARVQDFPTAVRFLEQSDGSRKIRFVVDLPPNQLGPGWRRKAG
jgi:hypothetical protein